MYGRAIKCDVCMNVEFINYQDVLVVDEQDAVVPKGWLRIHVNRPRAWQWDMPHGNEARSPIERAVDCCAIDCAKSVLNDAYDAIPK
jgi:hypothetical protein